MGRKSTSVTNTVMLEDLTLSSVVSLSYLSCFDLCGEFELCRYVARMFAYTRIDSQCTVVFNCIPKLGLLYCVVDVIECNRQPI